MKSFFRNRFFKGALLLGVIWACAGCGAGQLSPSAAPRMVSASESFVTLHDVPAAGQSGFVEDTEKRPDQRVVRVRAKSAIQNNQRDTAKSKSVESAKILAVDAMVRELLSSAVYNTKYPEIATYLTANADKYIDDFKVLGEAPIYRGTHYGILSEAVVNRNKLLKGIEKDLKLVNVALNRRVLVELVSAKEIRFEEGEGANARYQDWITIFRRKILAAFNRSGLEANVLGLALKEAGLREEQASSVLDHLKGTPIGAGSAEAAVRQEAEYREVAYEKVRELANVVVELNIRSFTFNARQLIAQVNLTALRVDQPGGKPILSMDFEAGRENPADFNLASTALEEDLMAQIQKGFVPDLRNEMSSVQIDEGDLMAFELIFVDFSDEEFGGIRRALQRIANPDSFVIRDVENVTPGIAKIFIRSNQKPFEIGDLVLGTLTPQYRLKEPRYEKNSPDLVLFKN